MKSLKYIIAAAVISVAAEAQQVNTLYFMNNVQERSEYNPAFQPEHDIYVDLPVLPPSPKVCPAATTCIGLTLILERWP